MWRFYPPPSPITCPDAEKLSSRLSPVPVLPPTGIILPSDNTIDFNARRPVPFSATAISSRRTSAAISGRDDWFRCRNVAADHRLGRCAPAEMQLIDLHGRILNAAVHHNSNQLEQRSRCIAHTPIVVA